MAKDEAEVLNEGPEVSREDLSSFYDARMHEEGERKSDAGESAAKTREFLDATGLNGQAVNVGKSALKKLKMKNGQIKAMDFIRSVLVIANHMEAHLMRNSTTEMQLDEEDPMGKPTADVASPDEAEPEADADLDEAVADLEEDNQPDAA